jgi:copper chaperone NosL
MGPAEPARGRRPPWRSLALGALALVGLAALVRGVLLAQRPPEGPQPVAWDRVACARCGMLVSDPRFAAQAHTRGGAVLDFDDPGCALLWAHEHEADLHALWFHDLEAERWLRRGEAGFVPAQPTPMGYGLGARPRGSDGALTPDEALAFVLDREASRAEARP